MPDLPIAGTSIVKGEDSSESDGECTSCSPSPRTRASPCTPSKTEKVLRRRRATRSMSPCRKRHRSASQKQQTKLDSDCLVYVGNIERGMREGDLVQVLWDFLQKLPEGGRYPTPASLLAHSSPARLGNAGYLFLTFADPAVAATVIAMSGLVIRGRSARITRPKDSVQNSTNTCGFDVELLRREGLLPQHRGVGAQMLTEVYIGHLPCELRDPEALKAQLSEAILKIPAVSKRHPRTLEPVVKTSVGSGGAYAFALMSSEMLASTLVAMRKVTLDTGTVTTGWPSRHQDAAIRAAPAFAGARQTKKCDHEEVHVSGMQGLTSHELKCSLEAAFHDLPAYHEQYPAGVDVVVRIQTGKSNFSFVLFADGVLASTAVEMGSLWVSSRTSISRRVRISWPARMSRQVLDQAPAPLRGTRHVQDQVSAPLQRNHANVASMTCPDVSFDEPVTIWVSNFPRAGACRTLLDRHLNWVALSLPDFDVEAGPPVTRVEVSTSCTVAFVELRDMAVAKRLMDAFDGSHYYGYPLAVGWAKPKRGKDFPKVDGNDK